jgi:hypothetical protein
MTKMLGKVAPWLLSAALCVLAAEIFGAAAFLYQDGGLVYRNTRAVAEPEVQAAATYKPRWHPYFGYTGPYSLTNKMGNPNNTNNLGFVQRGEGQDRIVPFKPEPNDFVVFVFGSSIAGALASAMRGSLPLRDNLQKLAQLKGKNVIVYSMAQGPQKQPQQLMELAFLLAIGQHIDLVLNVGGAVEFVSGLSNFESGVDPIFPPAEMLIPIGQELTPADSSSADYYELAFRVSRDRAGVKLYSKLVAESSSGLGFLKNRFILGFYSRTLANDIAKYEATITQKRSWVDIKKLLSLDMPVSVTKENLMDAIFQTWLRCSDMMKLLANANGAVFLDIVNPNMYYSKKKLTADEQALLKENSNVARGSSAGYSLIEQRADMLKSRNIVNASTLFDDVPETVYEDSTGHFTRLGETLFGQFVADQVAARLDSAGVKSQSLK